MKVNGDLLSASDVMPMDTHTPFTSDAYGKQNCKQLSRRQKSESKLADFYTFCLRHLVQFKRDLFACLPTRAWLTHFNSWVSQSITEDQVKFFTKKGICGICMVNM